MSNERVDLTSKTLSELEDDREKEDIKKIEAVLFVSGRFLSLADLVNYTDLNPLIIRELIVKLGEKYASEDFSMEIVKKNDMWKMDVKPDYSYLINKLATGSSEFAKSEQETLAII